MGTSQANSKSTNDLIHSFEQKIQYLTEQIAIATNKPILSAIREEYANNIAVALRSMVTYTSSCESLMKRCGFDYSVFFPLYDSIAALNILPQYNLVQIFWNSKNRMGTFCVADDIDNKEIVRKTYMTFDNWKNESVIDFHSNDFPPLSREKVIRIVADKLGAHVDSRIEEHLYKVESDHILPIFFEQDGTVYYGDGRNLFTETILGIAKELVFAYTYSSWKNLVSAGKPESYLYTQDYQGAKKYVVHKICDIKINAYNANPFFQCTVTEEKLNRFKVVFRDRMYNIGIIGR